MILTWSKSLSRWDRHLRVAFGMVRRASLGSAGMVGLRAAGLGGFRDDRAF